MIVAIDGPAGAGKGVVSKLVAEKLGFERIDTGAMYRAVTLQMIREKMELNEIEKVESLLDRIIIELKTIDKEQKVFLNGEDVSKEIREVHVDNMVSFVSSIKEIRIKMVELSRKIASKKDIVMEGRDITTVVFPNADIKIYLTADRNERIKRRYNEMTQKGIKTTYEEVEDNIIKRDKNDIEKEMGALKIAKDAVVIDSTYKTVEEVTNEIISLIKGDKKV